MIKKLLLCLLAVLPLVVHAVPAKRGASYVATQPDGSSLTVLIVGDEHFHALLTTDSLMVGQDASGTYYYRSVDGLTGVMAHDKGFRDASERDYLSSSIEKISWQYKAVREQLFKKRQRLNGNTINRGLTADFPVHGSPKIPVILVQFPDKKMKNSNPVAQFQSHFNTKDKSVAQYFSDQSNGDFTPQFDVFGPYTTVNNMAYYGANDPNGVGGACHLAKAIGEMIVEACTALDDEIDFSQYDYDGDGFCDALTIIFAGLGEHNGGGENTVWAHKFELEYTDYGAVLTLDGVNINKYVTTCENQFLTYNGNVIEFADGIGTMCHEFSHALGLPDFYDVSYSGNFGMGDWDIMDRGGYLDGGNTPCNYSAYEKEFMGWKSTTIASESRKYTLDSNANLGEAVKIINPHNNDGNEFYIVENRQKTGWDKNLPAAGLIIYYVDEDEYAWANNCVNTFEYGNDHQRMKIIPCDGTHSYDNEAGDLWPYSGNNTFNNTSLPAATVYNGGFLDRQIMNITKNSNGTVSFLYFNTPQVTIPVSEDPSQVDLTSFRAHWSDVAVEGATTTYTLKVIEKPRTSRNRVIHETMGKCVNEGTTNIASTLKNYMDTTGWAGSYVYESVGGIRIGREANAGYLTSPGINLTNHDPLLTVRFTASLPADATEPAMLTVSCGSISTKTAPVTTNGQQEFLLLLDAKAATAQKVKFATVKGSPVIVNSIDIYTGDAREMLSSTSLRAVAESGDAFARTITGITDTTYLVSNLNPLSEYEYQVKAIYDAKIESEWSNTVDVKLLSMPNEVPVMLPAKDVTATSFVAQWSDELLKEPAASYTLRVDLEEKGAPQMLIEEDMSKCTTTSTTNISGKLDSYLNTAGWTGKYVYQHTGGLRLGTASYVGYITSPALDLTDKTGLITVHFTAMPYPGDQDVNFVISCGNSSQRVVLPNDTVGEYVILLDADKTANQKVKFSTLVKNKRVVVTGLEIYSGDARGLLSNKAKAIDITGDSTSMIISGIEGLSYQVNDLIEGEKYLCQVRAVYNDGNVSPWSNVTGVSLIKALPLDVNCDGAVTSADITALYNYILNGDLTYINTSDVDGDGAITAADVTVIYNYLLLGTK